MSPQEMKKIDKFLIEKCMKWKWVDQFGSWFPSADQLGRTVQIDDGYSKKAWRPTTSIEQAMMCAKKMEDKWHWELYSPFIIDEPYFAGFTPLGVTGWNGRPDHQKGAETPELAICLAIEKALEVNHGS